VENNHQELVKENQALKKKVALLEQKLDAVIRKLYGKSSEKLDPNQLELLSLDLEPPGKEEASVASTDALLAEPGSAKPKKTRRERKPRLPEDLPVIEETVIEPDAVKADPQGYRRIGEEVTELLDFEPGRFVRRRIIRPTYVKRIDNFAPPITAQLPALLIDGGIVAPGLLAHIVIGKYCDHLPLYRQEQIYKERYDVSLPRQTLCRWISIAAFWCRAIYEEIARTIFAQRYLQGDETPIRYLQPGSGKAQIGYLWTYNVPGGDTLYDWHASRGHECLKKRLGLDFSGTLQCDGYVAYQTYARQCEAVILAGCWAHARRYFYDAREQSPIRATWILRQLQNLYRIEARLREKKAGPALREAVRCAESAPIVNRIRRALFRFRADPRCLPKSLLGQACDYTLGQWEPLQVYLREGAVEIDNNLVENAIRPTAVGKKGWLFFGSRNAGQDSAILFTIVATCRKHGVEPFEYLRWLFTELPGATNQQIGQMTPRAYAGAKAARLRLAS
jgi:transposase